MLTPDQLKAAHTSALSYSAYLATAKPHELPGWQAQTARVKLTTPQSSFIATFTRKMPVLVFSGTWCGDCVQQCPIFAAIASANPLIDLRFLDRDLNITLANHFKICGGNRVPTLLMLNEDFEFCALAGDKTLAKLRRQAAAALGANCPLPGAPIEQDELLEVTQEWVDTFERAALLLRLSGKLRQRHND